MPLVQISLTPEQHQALKIESIYRKTSLRRLIAAIIANYIEDQKPEEKGE